MEIEKVKEKLRHLDESEAKSLLLLMYARLDTAINGSGGDEVIKEAAIDVLDTLRRLPSRRVEE
ncbi:hypothetical protein [Paenibacillus xanthanilyticus]|uniref:Phage protein n=1 Tax=Paenibacillus xanthanilyticus TaxID=1783531 RepID=A0ABV8K900_9BACL